MYSTIVVGTDGSATAAAAVDRAVALAVAGAGHLHIVSAYSPPSRAMTFGAEVGYVAGQGQAGWDEEAHQQVQAMLDASAAEAVSKGAEVSTHAIAGTPADVLLQVALAEGADLVVVGNRGMTGVRRVIGSVPNSVAHKARCDVLIVHTT